MDTKANFDVIVIGSGPAGTTSGVFLSRARFNTLLLDSQADYPASVDQMPLSRSSVSGEYRNVPLFPEGISREELKWRGIQQAQYAGCSYRLDEVVGIKKDHTLFMVQTPSTAFTAEHIFFAQGVQDIWPDIPGMRHYVGRSLFWSVTSNGKEAEGKVAGVLGHTDYAALEAIRLHELGDSVYVLTHGVEPQFSSPMMQVLAYLKIPLLTERVKILVGDNEGRLEKVILGDGQEVDVQVLFFSPAYRKPRSELAQSLGAHVDTAGFIQVNERYETNIPNVYAVGDVTSRGPEFVITSFYQGMQAALGLYEDYFERKLHQLLTHVTLHPVT